MDKKSPNLDCKSVFPNIEAWMTSIPASELLAEISHLIKSCIILSDHEARTIALWIVFTYFVDVMNFSPILNITSPEKRCGKSTLAALLTRLVYKPMVASNITPPALFRTIDAWAPTLIIDESDTFLNLNEELRGILNSGHSRELAYTIRCTGKNHEPRRFTTWCPKVIVGIGSVPETIADRSIVVRLRRKLVGDEIQSFRTYPIAKTNELVSKCLRLKQDCLEKIKSIKVTLPKELNDRGADNWESLFLIAYLAGEQWLEYANKAAIHLSKDESESMGTGVEMLQDIKNIFHRKNFLGFYTNELISELCSDLEAPWATYNDGKPITPRQLAKKLKEFNIRSKDIRLPPHNNNLKGYLLKDFEDAFMRYIPS